MPLLTGEPGSFDQPIEPLAGEDAVALHPFQLPEHGAAIIDIGVQSPAIEHGQAGAVVLDVDLPQFAPGQHELEVPVEDIDETAVLTDAQAAIGLRKSLVRECSSHLGADEDHQLLAQYGPRVVHPRPLARPEIRRIDSQGSALGQLRQPPRPGQGANMHAVLRHAGKGRAQDIVVKTLGFACLGIAVRRVAGVAEDGHLDRRARPAHGVPGASQ
ncbi:hypothetical protein D3C84_614470 [compost metagenome]